MQSYDTIISYVRRYKYSLSNTQQTNQPAAHLLQRHTPYFSGYCIAVLSANTAVVLAWLRIACPRQTSDSPFFLCITTIVVKFRGDSTW